MTKVWDGETPDDKDWRYARGYQEAMNSPIVKALYEALKAMSTSGHDSNCGIFVVVRGRTMLDRSLCNCVQRQRKEALAAYEAGLGEESKP